MKTIDIEIRQHERAPPPAPRPVRPNLRAVSLGDHDPEPGHRCRAGERQADAAGPTARHPDGPPRPDHGRGGGRGRGDRGAAGRHRGGPRRGDDPARSRGRRPGLRRVGPAPGRSAGDRSAGRPLDRSSPRGLSLRRPATIVTWSAWGPSRGSRSPRPGATASRSRSTQPPPSTIRPPRSGPPWQPPRRSSSRSPRGIREGAVRRRRHLRGPGRPGQRPDDRRVALERVAAGAQPAAAIVDARPRPPSPSPASTTSSWRHARQMSATSAPGSPGSCGATSWCCPRAPWWRSPTTCRRRSRQRSRPPSCAASPWPAARGPPTR